MNSTNLNPPFLTSLSIKRLLSITVFSLHYLFAGNSIVAQTAIISFDLPPTAIAIPAGEGTADGLLNCDDGEPVEITLRLSSLVNADVMPQIDRWMIRCVPRHSDWRVIDYAPRTETASDYATAIGVKTTNEKTSTFGVAADLTQGNLVRGHVGGDLGSKQCESLQYDRVAPLHAVTAAGTIERGRGVYYKLRWTSTQVLEGEKEFKVKFAVPVGFRSGLVDVSVVAIGRPSNQSSVTAAIAQIPVIGDDVGGMRSLGEARFVVGVYAEGDPVARQVVQSMTDAEATLRREADKVRAGSPARSLSTLIRHVASKLDMDSVDVHSNWPERLIFNNADPYTDPIIRKLPTDLRVKALDYCDARRKVESLRTRESETEFQLTELVKASISQ